MKSSALGLFLSASLAPPILTLGCSAQSDSREKTSTDQAPPDQGANATDGSLSSNIVIAPSDEDPDDDANGLNTQRDGGVIELSAEEAAGLSDAACTGWAAEGENLPAVLQFVVDVSHSMGRTEESTGSNTKWEVTKEALETAINELPDSVAVGMLLYPHRSNIGANATERPIEECMRVDKMVPMAPLGDPGTGQRALLQEYLDGAHIGGRTPTHDAYQYALESGLKPYETIARKFMLLITDGAPTISEGCIKGATGTEDSSPTDVIVDDIAAAHAEGIRTFLIGSPGSEGTGGEDRRPWLSEAAQEGGTAAADCDIAGPNFCHMDMTEATDFAKALREGLAAISGQIIDACTFSVPDAPAGETIDPKKTNVIVLRGDGSVALLLPDDEGDCTEGWQFDAAGNISLCAQSCDAIKADPLSSVTLNFGCAPQDLLVR